MLKAIVILLVLAVAGLLIFAATKPDNFRIERSATIKAPAERVFALLNDFKQWEAWSPWEKVDPALKRSYGTSTSGVGAVYAWNGNKDIGAGRMEIIESTPPAKLVLRLDFTAPFEAHNTVEFTLVPQGDSTAITQAMFGPSPYLSKLMGIFFNVDKMVGDKYEEGFANLRALVEK